MDYRTMEYNKAYELAENIVIHHKNLFLNVSYGDEIHIEGVYTPKIMKWSRIDGFRSMSTKETTYDAAKEATGQWIKGNMGTGSDLAFLLVKSNNKNGVFYGTGTTSFNSFEDNLPEAAVLSEGPELLKTTYNGFILGSISSKVLADTVLSLDVDECYVSCVMLSLDSTEITERLTEIDSQIAFLSRFKSYTRTYGTATRRTEEISNPQIVQALETLEEIREFLKNHLSEGIAQTIIRLGAQSEGDFEQILAAVRACFRTERQEYIEPIRSFKLTGSEETWLEHLSVPEIRFSKASSEIRLLSLKPVSELKEICVPPLRSHNNYFVKNYGTNEDSIEVFEAPKSTVNGILFGKDKKQEAVMIPINLLCCHAAILGSAGGGKTTSVKKLLLSLHKNGIPFLVIEAAKKEYFDLSTAVPELQVYTPGTNGNRLSVNPLQPEEGVLIENQVDMLVRAITAAHGGEHPIPEGFEGLLKMTYEKAGWGYGMLAYDDSTRPFPTFEDVYKNVDEYVQGHARYGAENRQNLIAALELRSENLFSGALGKVCCTDDSISAKELLSSPTLIELDDFSESSVVFLMNVILFKLQSHLSKLEKTEDLKRVVVVEEAHNVFKKDNFGDQSREITNKYFERMLSEIRASGTGLIISDQRPSILSEALMQNTAIKIVHAMEERNDRDVVASSLDLSEIQIKKLREFIPGECILGMRGHFGLRNVLVDRPEIDPVKNVFCSICPRRFECMGHRDAMENVQIDIERTIGYLRDISASPFNLSFVKRRADCLMDDFGIKDGITAKCCAFGELLVKYMSAPIEMKRIIVEGYYRLLREEANDAE